ncbi:hypothetical protein [Tenacibaculum finnmarkense]|uniref:Uncharacterized protein n=1 Tax=Tenacibaculum finnmarkense genomovar finnmarkense TaxID=1458503 RepID=A0AAP1RH13_9FLAO|nr:hypothetical protein [Tenacibaculum finnmarkense]MBE7653876.1 hypothetical protein [Tenacibaculum finnmarkense genomovar finnmarkense]MBE7696179.1 hypothetical protein [Tenacibaculum finnmarkense genomovar finnmarkense]MCD8428395.1 hypothetical protein [Tenacibaculum finnmarkense genomovar finnmarkense]MCG8732167.1 hypothetical protein [Tenacibaculum finnmarkense]MCG8752746.1 hypothetical protein [Tenacibaculum finnmarkense]
MSFFFFAIEFSEVKPNQELKQDKIFFLAWCILVQFLRDKEQKRAFFTQT